MVATAFAYEGWIIATSINAELHDAKKNLPKALVMGTLLVMVVYILYYIGLAGGVSNAVMMEKGEEGAKMAFETIFSRIGGTGFSCLCRNFLPWNAQRADARLHARNVFSGWRGVGPAPQVFSQVDKATNMPTNSSIFGLLLWRLLACLFLRRAADDALVRADPVRFLGAAYRYDLCGLHSDLRYDDEEGTGSRPCKPFRCAFARDFRLHIYDCRGNFLAQNERGLVSARIRGHYADRKLFFQAAKDRLTVRFEQKRGAAPGLGAAPLLRLRPDFVAR